MEIEEPIQLLAAFPQHVLRISSKAHQLRRWTKDLNDYTYPEDELLIRYESDANFLYVDAKLFKKYKLEVLSAKLRCNDQYQGAKTKRMEAGIADAKNSSARVMIFNLDRRSVQRDSLRDVLVAQKRERRDKLMIEAMDSLTFVNKAITRIQNRRTKINKRSGELKEGKPITLQEQKEFLGSLVSFYEEMELLLARSRFVLSEAHEIVESLRIKKRSRKVSKSTDAVDRVPMAERRRIQAIDYLVQAEFPNIHKMRYKWETHNGHLSKTLREVVPECDPTDIAGMYVEDSRSDGSGLRRELYFPVSVIRSYLLPASPIFSDEQKAELLQYKSDVRYVSIRAHRIGGKVQRCAYFDMTLSENTVNKLEKGTT